MLTLSPIAWGAPAEPDITAGHDVVVFVPDFEMACDLGEGDLTVTLNGNLREITNDNGFHEGEAITTTWTFVHDAGGTSAGRTTQTYAENVRNGSDDVIVTQTTNGEVLSGVGAGTRFHGVTHYIGPEDDEGDVIEELAKLYFSDLRCT